MNNFIYQASFPNGEKFYLETISLDEAQSLCIEYMEENAFNECNLVSETKSIHYITKNGNYHWKHNGYTFQSIVNNDFEFKEIERKRKKYFSKN